jgi:hypothetical protein
MSSRRLVVDASVAGAAGSSQHPTSKSNRDFLREVWKVCHKVVMPPEISEEWKEHSSKFTQGWRKSMVAARKLLAVPSVPNAALRRRINRFRFTPRQRRAVEKDAPLVEAALAADRIVISRDAEARALFSALAPDWPPLFNVVWLQPDANPGEALEWLRRGARPVRKWQLGPRGSRRNTE